MVIDRLTRHIHAAADVTADLLCRLNSCMDQCVHAGCVEYGLVIAKVVQRSPSLVQKISAVTRL